MSFLSIFLLSSFLSIVHLHEYRSNAKFVFLLTDQPGNIYENYAFCSKFGMKPIWISDEDDEKTIRKQENRNIKRVWIDTTYVEVEKTGCDADCCGIQMDTVDTDDDPDYRSVSCSDLTATIACQRVSSIFSS